ncbi:MAG: fructuronate reductase [Actinomycetota bacterium]|nr:fructuronate reductase [Actinomycetota bacterium]
MNGRPGPRLTSARLAEVIAGPDVALPARRPDRTGIVHLGIGAFHRAHQAVFTEDAAALTGEGCWGICGVTLRSASVVEQLEPQDCLYTVLQQGAGARTARVVGSVREVLFAKADPNAVPERIADPAVHVVTLTVTEKGYRRGADGGLDLDDPVVHADLGRDPAGPRSVVGLLVAGLEQRLRAGGEPLSVVCCDNLTANGRILRRLVLDFCSASGPGGTAAREDLARWVDDRVSFPSTVVDRIVPATTEQDRRTVCELLGVQDEGVVVAEPFRQWVIEDSFAGARPSWELAGALLVGDVAPWEAVKLRLLNATHSTLAYLGALRGYETVARAVADPELERVARELMSQDAAATLRVPEGLDVADYCEQVMERFADPALRHRTTQIAMDGSQKLPLRLLGIISERLAAGEKPLRAALGVSAWMVYVARAAAGQSAPGGLSLPLQDPLRDRLCSVATAGSTPRRLVEGLLGIPEIFGAELPEDTAFRSLLTEQVTALGAGRLP